MGHDAPAPPDFELSGPLMRPKAMRIGLWPRTIGHRPNQIIVFYQGETSMNSIKTMMAILLCSMLTLPARADAISGGKVTSVNAEGTSFTFTKKRKHWTFRITDKTVFRVGEKTGKVSDLKIGQPVKVEFQREGAWFTALLIGVGF
jgi:hypothetical protein